MKFDIGSLCLNFKLLVCLKFCCRQVASQNLFLLQLLLVLTGGGVFYFVAKYLIKIQKCICFNSVTDEVPEIEILAPSNSLQIPTYWQQWKYQRNEKC